ncbi:MAG: glucokinase [Pseudomonadota bacterium]|nr:glucokinase [Pseudomonadota bacterium]
MIALLADIGGTKSQLALMNEQGEFIHRMTVLNLDHPSFDALVDRFLRAQPAPQCAILAVAGPVDDGIRCRMTNLNWLIDGAALQQRLQLKFVNLLNDLQATAWSMTDPGVQSRLSMLRGSGLNFEQPVVVISPGTGLGEACIQPHQGQYVIQGTEGGHKSIAPFNRLSAELILQHWQQHNYPPSWENWFSGSGFSRLFQTMFPGAPVPDNATMGQQAISDPDSPSARCMELFAQAIYAEAGNLVLQYLAWGGVIVAGGIPPKLGKLFYRPEHIAYIERKNQYIDRLGAVPVALCQEADAPLTGAATYCKTLWQESS